MLCTYTHSRHLVQREHACCDKVSFIFGVLKAFEEPCGKAQRGGMALAEGCSNHGPYVNHGALWANRQATPHRCRTGDEFDPQCTHIEHLRQHYQRCCSGCLVGRVVESCCGPS